MNEINKANGEYYGIEKQMIVLVEETAELAQAATKWLRKKQNGQTVRKSYGEIMENLIEELADVSIMVDQIKHLLNLNERDFQYIRAMKIKRTAEYIAQDKEAKRHEQSHDDERSTRGGAQRPAGDV